MTDAMPGEEPDQVAIRCTVLRGGTSKGVYLLEHDIPPPGPLRDRLLKRIMGTPDILQIDGLGGSRPMEWIGRVHAAGVQVGAINDVVQALQEPQLQSRNMLIGMPHPLNPDFAVVGNPINLSDTPMQYFCPPPTFGEHTGEVLRDRIGLSGEQLGFLEKADVIQRPELTHRCRRSQ